MSKLVTTPNIADGDGFYADLMAATETLSEEQTHLFNARLILVLANQIGDRAVLAEAIALAAKE